MREWVRQDPVSAGIWQRYQASGYREHSLVQAQVPGGAVGADDQAKAYWATFRYQRLHADSFRELLTLHRFAAAVDGDVLLVDIGCGAGTVGIATAEAMPAEAGGIIRYVGTDHNRTMLKLAGGLLRSPDVLPQGSTVDVVDDLATAVRRARAAATTCSLAVLACSYVFNQPSLDTSSVEHLAEAVAAIADSCAAPLRVCTTDPTGRGPGRYPAFLALLQRRARVEVVVRDGTLTHPARYPNLHADEEPMIVRQRTLPTVLYQMLRITPR